MKPLSPCQSDRLTGFATILYAGYDRIKGRRRNWLALAVPSLVLVAAIGHLTVARVEGAKPPIPPTWSQILPAAQRFQLVMGSAAVLDQETGLVWEQSPDTEPQGWLFAQLSCNVRTVGGRLGWRLPTLQELASLVDPTQSNPALPAGHPFSNVQSSGYWSASTEAGSLSLAWLVNLLGFVGNDGKTNAYHVWCVRGGQGVDPQ